MDKKKWILEEIYYMIEIQGFYEENKDWDKAADVERRINNYMELLKTLECA